MVNIGHVADGKFLSALPLVLMVKVSLAQEILKLVAARCMALKQ